jgi:hypothetical protein
VPKLSNEINVFLKNRLGKIFCQILLSKKRCFQHFLGQKCGKLAILAPFLYIPGGLEGLLTSLTSPTTTPRPGTPPADSWHTKQFFSRPHGL